MTTILVHAKTMTVYADSRVTKTSFKSAIHSMLDIESSEEYFDDYQKIHRLSSDEILTGAGDANDINTALMHIKYTGKMHNKPFADDDTVMYIVCKLEGDHQGSVVRVTTFRNTYVSFLKIFKKKKLSRRTVKLDPDGHCATGSGSKYLVGALDAGANITDAFNIAFSYDKYSGGDITSMEIK